jgi:hypothetical protein
MMFDEPLTPDIEQFESKLSAAFAHDPPPALRSRVVAAVRGELRRKRATDRWKRAMVIAATLLVWANLTFCAYSLSGVRYQREGAGLPVDQMARELRKIAPELSREEAYRQALAMSANSNIFPVRRDASHM